MLKKLFNKLRNAKTGFSLIELVVCIAILAVLAGVLIPSFIGSSNEARSDSDDAVMAHLAEIYKTAIQEHDIYNYFSQTVQKLDEGEQSVYFWYKTDDDGNVSFYAMNLEYPDASTEDQRNEILNVAGQLKVKARDYVNGSYEIPKMEARNHRNRTYVICVSATKREFLVNVTSNWLEEAEPDR